MHERFTDRARKVMQLANQEAQRLNHEYIGTEHILLGLVKEGSAVAANVLNNLDIDVRKIRLEIEKIVRLGPDMLTMRKWPQTPRAKKVIDYAVEEARNFNHEYVGTEHLLLGLLREQKGVAAQVLMNLGLKLEDVHEEILFLHLNDPPWELPPITRKPDYPEDAWKKKPHLPPETIERLKKLEAEIRQLDEEKEEAVAAQDFEKAARLRDRADKLRRKIQKLIS